MPRWVLKTVERQAKDQRQKLHITEIELATQRQLVLELKASLQKVKEAAWMAKEASRAMEMAAYECDVLETETQLANEVVGVCRDYCTEV